MNMPTHVTGNRNFYSVISASEVIKLFSCSTQLSTNNYMMRVKGSKGMDVRVPTCSTCSPSVASICIQEQDVGVK